MSDSASSARCPPLSSVRLSFHTPPNDTRMSRPSCAGTGATGRARWAAGAWCGATQHDNGRAVGKRRRAAKGRAIPQGIKNKGSSHSAGNQEKRVKPVYSESSTGVSADGKGTPT
eukprot:39633-Chlamydomonas_euryale.AAC.3